MSHEATERIVDAGVIAVVRGVSGDAVVPVAEALHEGGIRALEVTMDSGDALESIERVREALPAETLVGAGTVLDAETARAAQLAGAEFVVAPNFDPGTVEACNRYGVPVAPGIATPTEAVNARSAGADLLKLFPAANLGPSYLSRLLGPLDVPVVPTGGVDQDNAGAFIEAGAVAVGAGSALVSDEAVDAGDYDAIRANAEAMVAAVEDARE